MEDVEPLERDDGTAIFSRNECDSAGLRVCFLGSVRPENLAVPEWDRDLAHVGLGDGGLL